MSENTDKRIFTNKTFFMKETKLLTLFTAALALAACSSSDERTSVSDKVEAQFVATIDGKTRAYDTYWDKADQIGVTGTSGEKAYSNVAYQTAAGDGKFAAVSDGSEIYFQDDNTVSFTAYYPWNSSTTITANTYNQKQQEQFDFLYASAQGSKASPLVSFRFAHKMSKVMLTLQCGDDVTYEELKAATISLAGFKNNGTFDGLTGMTTTTGDVTSAWLLAGNTANENYNAPISTNDTKETVAYQLILFPQDLAQEMTLVATLAQSFKANIDLTTANKNGGDATPTNSLVAGRQYNLKVTLSKTALIVNDCTIENWDEVDGGTFMAD